MIGRLVSEPYVETVKNGDAKALFAEVKFATGEIRTVQLFPGINREAWPRKDDVVVAEFSGGLLYAAAAWDGEEPMLKPGEFEAYSRDADRKKVARTHFDNKGNIFTDADGNVETNIKGDEKRKIEGSFVEEIAGDATNFIHGNRAAGIAGDDSTGIDGNSEKEISGDSTEKIGGDANRSIGGDMGIKIGGAANINADGSMGIKAAVINLN